jgi:hypothetical protein
MLFRLLNIFCTSTTELFAVSVQYPIWLFYVDPRCRIVFPGMILRYCLSDFERVRASDIIAITFAYTLLLLLLLLLC